MSFLMPKINIPQPATPAQQPVSGKNTSNSGAAPSFLGASATPEAAPGAALGQKKLLGA